MTKHQGLLFLIILFSVLSLKGFGQSSELRGYVKSKTPDDNLIIASVSLLNSAGEIVYSTTTDVKYGEYVIDSIAHGRYTIQVSAPGFKTRNLTDFEIRADHRLVKNINLLPEFSRFSKKEEEEDPNALALDNDYEEKERMIQYVMYSGLAVVLVAVLALQ